MIYDPAEFDELASFEVAFSAMLLISALLCTHPSIH